MRVAKLHHGDPIETGITALQRPLMTPIIPKYFCCLLKQHRDALTISFKIIVAIPKIFRNFGLSKILDQKISTIFLQNFEMAEKIFWLERKRQKWLEKRDLFEINMTILK